MLLLASIQPARSDATPLWSAVIDTAVTLEGADAFTIDSTTQHGRTDLETSQDIALLRSLGVAADDRRRDLRLLDSKRTLLAELGTRVLSIDLYAQREWVAGISDWGDDIATLFGEASWAKLCDVMQNFDPAPDVDIAETMERPKFV